MPNITKMSAKRVTMLTTSMDANNRDTDEASMKRHSKGFKDFVNNVEDFDDKKIEEYCNEYCQDNNNFNEIEVVEKPKRTLSDEQKAKMKAGREAAKAAREAAKAEKVEEAVKAEESEEDDEAEEKPKVKAKAKVAKA
jgi:hypothetical protein